MTEILTLPSAELLAAEQHCARVQPHVPSADCLLRPFRRARALVCACNGFSTPHGHQGGDRPKRQDAAEIRISQQRQSNRSKTPNPGSSKEKNLSEKGQSGGSQGSNGTGSRRKVDPKKLQEEEISIYEQRDTFRSEPSIVAVPKEVRAEKNSKPAEKSSKPTESGISRVRNSKLSNTSKKGKVHLLRDSVNKFSKEKVKSEGLELKKPGSSKELTRKDLNLPERWGNSKFKAPWLWTSAGMGVTQESFGRKKPKITEDFLKYAGKISVLQLSKDGKKKKLQLLLNQGMEMEFKDGFGASALTWASKKGYLDIVKALLDAGADPNTKTEEGLTPLHAAAYHSFIDIVEALIDAGADIDAVADKGVTPLHNSSSQGHINVTRLLVARGADVDATGDDGITPLLNAAIVGHNDAVDILIEGGADVNCLDLWGWSPAHFAAYYDYSWTVKSLQRAGALMNAKTNDTKKYYDVTHTMGCTPLHVAAKRGHVEVTEVLLDVGANKMVRDSKGRLPSQVIPDQAEGRVELLEVLT